MVQWDQEEEEEELGNAAATEAKAAKIPVVFMMNRLDGVEVWEFEEGFVWSSERRE